MNTIAPDSAVLVTGASGAIGGEIARQAAAAGAIVGVHGSRAERVEAAVAALAAEQPDARLIPIVADFRDYAQIEGALATLADAAGRLDAVIHCATAGRGGRTAGAFAGTEPRDFGLHTEALLATFQQLCFAALPHLARRGGTIVGFASDAGRFAAPRQAMVGAAFGGIMAFVRNLAVEVARDKVRVHCIAPTYVVDTPIFERVMAAGNRAEAAMRRAGLSLPSPADIAPLALFLCGPGAARITGQVISVNGGLNA